MRLPDKKFISQKIKTLHHNKHFKKLTWAHLLYPIFVIEVLRNLKNHNLKVLQKLDI